jgi:WD40 repeat protein
MDVASLSLTGRLRGHVMSVHAATFSPDGTRVATGGGPGEPVKIWDFATQQELMTLFVEGHFFRHVEFSPDGDAILAIGGSGSLHLWRVPTFEEIQASEAQRGVGAKGVVDQDRW